jgi:hypothetical protein
MEAWLASPEVRQLDRRFGSVHALSAQLETAMQKLVKMTGADLFRPPPATRPTTRGKPDGCVPVFVACMNARICSSASKGSPGS